MASNTHVVEKKRLQLLVNTSDLETIENLQLRTGASSKKELVSDAIDFYEWAINEVCTGNSILSVNDDNGKSKQLINKGMLRIVRALLKKSNSLPEQ